MRKGDVIRGMISVGEAHPLYNKETDLIVLCPNTGYDRKQTYVRSKKKVLFSGRHANVFADGRFIRTVPVPDIFEYAEGFLKN